MSRKNQKAKPGTSARYAAGTQVRGRRQLWLYFLLALCLATPACGQGGETPDTAVQECTDIGLTEETSATACACLLNYLADGGRVYVGTIEAVTMRERIGDTEFFGDTIERGDFTVRVLRTVRGPAGRHHPSVRDASLVVDSVNPHAARLAAPAR
jgi:hypothetical protein